MQFYVASPTRTKSIEDHPLFRFDVSTLVCSTHPTKMVILGDTSYTSLIQADMTDAELDQLIEKATEARAKRREMKAATLAMLAESEYDDGAISMDTAERLQALSSAVLAETAPVFTDSTRCTALSIEGDRCIEDAGHDGDHLYVEDVR